MLTRNSWPLITTGLLTTLQGIGLARFSFTPLIPELVRLGWFSSAETGYLASANLVGYFIGALTANRLAKTFSLAMLFNSCSLLIIASFACSSQPASFEWFLIWRFIAGVCGAILMVTGPSFALTQIPVNQRPLAGGFIFSGIGIGAILASVIIPLLLESGLILTWFCLTFLSALSGLAIYFIHSNLDKKKQTLNQSTGIISNTPQSANRPPITLVLLLLFIAYACDATGFIPHTIFWSDFLANEQKLGIYKASFQWAVFGIGAVFGPFIAATTAHKLGWHRALVIAFLIKSIAIALPLFSIEPVFLTLSSFWVGAMVPGVVSLLSGRISQLVAAENHRYSWGIATACFALFQALSGYAMAFIHTLLGSYLPLFIIGSGALFFGFILVTASGQLERNSRRQV